MGPETFTRNWLTPNAIRDPHNPRLSRSLCCPQGQSSCRHSSWAAGQALSGLVSLGQFPTSGAKLHFSLLGLVSRRKTEANPCFFSSLSCFQELWSCSPSGVGGSGGGTSPAGIREQGWSPPAARGVCCGLAVQGETGGPPRSAAVDQMLNQDPTCPALAVRKVASSKT